MRSPTFGIRSAGTGFVREPTTHEHDLATKPAPEYTAVLDDLDSASSHLSEDHSVRKLKTPTALLPYEFQSEFYLATYL
jgi:hypothetical protein